MRAELPIDSWQATRDTLHLWTQVVGKIRMALSPPVNHWWHVTLYLSARGLRTGPIPVPDGILDIEFDFIEHALVLRTSDGGDRTFPLAGHSVASFYESTLNGLHELGVEARIHPVPNEVVVAIPFAEDTEHCTYVPEQAHAYWRQLIDADRQLRTFRADFTGKVSPVHYFWGAMDLAVTRFSGRTAPEHPGGAPNCPDRVMLEGYSHELSSAGFWPGGGAEGAYYSYAYPAPDGFEETPVPDGAFYSPDLGEFLLPYETVRQSDDPDALVQQFLQATYQAAAVLGHWPDPAEAAQ